ncbi:unnamed protein product [Amoebophrya sp. A25]|nr:unnamed protein product [Amoebophrya sp. A25]|eukprot:GSA25T00016364001.1
MLRLTSTSSFGNIHSLHCSHQCTTTFFVIHYLFPIEDAAIVMKGRRRLSNR